jgi:branched-chain amino acid transport system substrate-binding protein
MNNGRFPGPVRKRGLLAWLALATTALVLVAACSSSNSDDSKSTGAAGSAAPSGTSPGCTQAKGNGIKVGALYSASGTYGEVGSEVYEGVKYAIDALNACGGIDGRPVEVVSEDWRSNSSLIVSLANQLVQSGVVAILGPETNAGVQPIIPVTTAGKTPMLDNSGALPLVGDYNFSTNVTGYIWQLTADFAKSKGEDKLCGLAVAGGSFDALKILLAQGAAKAGIQLGTVLPFDPTAQDLSPQLTQMRSAGCKVIYASGAGASLLTVARGVQALGMSDVSLITIPTNANQSVLSSLTPAEAKSIYFQLPKTSIADQLKANDPARAVIQEFINGWKQSHAAAPTPSQSLGYSTAQVLIQALKSGARTGEEIRAFLKSGTAITTPFTAYSFKDSNSGTVPDHDRGWFVLARWNLSSKTWDGSYEAPGS